MVTDVVDFDGRDLTPRIAKLAEMLVSLEDSTLPFGPVGGEWGSAPTLAHRGSRLTSGATSWCRSLNQGRCQPHLRPHQQRVEEIDVTVPPPQKRRVISQTARTTRITMTMARSMDNRASDSVGVHGFAQAGGECQPVLGISRSVTVVRTRSV